MAGVGGGARQAPQGHRAAQKTVPGPAAHRSQCLHPCPSVLAPGSGEPETLSLVPSTSCHLGWPPVEVQGCFLPQLFRGSVGFQSSHQLLFALSQQFSEWDPWASTVCVTRLLLTCPLSPAPHLLNQTLGGPGHVCFTNPPGRFGALRCGTIASHHFSFWRHEQTKHQHMGHCPLHQF